jgi:hypothetical protein
MRPSPKPPKVRPQPRRPSAHHREYRPEKLTMERPAAKEIIQETAREFKFFFSENILGKDRKSHGGAISV